MCDRLDTLYISHVDVVFVADLRVVENPFIIEAEDRMAMTVLCLARHAAAKSANMRPAVRVCHQRHVVTTIPVTQAQIATVADDQGIISIGLDMSGSAAWQ